MDGRADGDANDTLRGVIVEVYRAGIDPQAAAVAAAWRAARSRPARAPLALLRTVLGVVAVVLYVVLATIVPLTVAFLLTITSPVLLWVAAIELGSTR